MARNFPAAAFLPKKFSGRKRDDRFASPLPLSLIIQTPLNPIWRFHALRDLEIFCNSRFGDSAMSTSNSIFLDSIRDLWDDEDDLMDNFFQILCFWFVLIMGAYSSKIFREYWVYPRQIVFWRDVASSLWLEGSLSGDYNFRCFYRMCPSNFENLFTLVAPYIPEADLFEMVREPIDKKLAFATVIHRLAHNDKCLVISQLFGIGASTVHKYTRIIVDILASRLRNDFIKPPDGPRLQEIISDFESISGVPQVAGVIDGSHIRLRYKPESHYTPADYWCRHHFHSILLQALCDASKLFWDVCCDAPGGSHDTRHFYTSPLYGKVASRQILNLPIRRLRGIRVKPFILGDSGYPASSFMVVVKKKRNGDTADDIAFSRRLSQVRVLIENSFALLKGRWKILEELPIRMPVIACCVLHNFLQLHGEEESIHGDIVIYGGGRVKQGESRRRREGNLLRRTIFKHMRDKNLLH